MTNVKAKAGCCGIDLQICDDGFTVTMRNGDTKKFTHAREAAIVFSQEVGSVAFYKVLEFLAAQGYDGYMGEKKRSEKA